LIEPVITAWKGRHRSVSGHQGAYAMREIVNAILYQGRTGCQWAYLPHDLPQKSATYYYFAAWRDDGTDQVIHELLRCQVRERARRLEDPTLVVLDTQSVHVATGVPATTSGHDPAKRVPGCKRGLAVDVLGLVIAVVVLAANTHDNAAGIVLLDQGEQAARALADDLCEQIDGLQNRLREAETRLEHLAITRTTVTGLADRLPSAAPNLPEHPDYPRILTAFNHATGPQRARDVCQARGHELLPKNVEGTRAKLKRLVKLVL
jgi:transposase